MPILFERSVGVSGQYVDQKIKCQSFSLTNLLTRQKSNDLFSILLNFDKNLRCEKYGFGDKHGTKLLSKVDCDEFYLDFDQKAYGGLRIERGKFPMIEMNLIVQLLHPEMPRERLGFADFNRLDMGISPLFFSDYENVLLLIAYLTSLHLWSCSIYTSGYHHEDFFMRNAIPDVVTVEGYPDDRNNYYTQAMNVYTAALKDKNEGKRCYYIRGGEKNVPDNLNGLEEILAWALKYAIMMRIDVRERCVDSYIMYYLSGLFWLQIFGRPYIEMFGREKLLKCPAYQVKELPDGSIMLLMAPSPLDYAKPEVRARAKQCEDFLGRDCFFQHDDGWGGYARGNRRVPVFDFSGLVMDQATMEDLAKLQPPPAEDPYGGMNVISRDTAAAIYLRSKDEKTATEGIEKYFQAMGFGVPWGNVTAPTTNAAENDLPLVQRRERRLAIVPLEGEWTMLVEEGTGYDVDIDLAERLSQYLKTTAIALVISENTGGVFYWKYINGKLTEEVVNTDDDFSYKLPREKTKGIEKDERKDVFSGDYILKNIIAPTGIKCFGLSYLDVVDPSCSTPSSVEGVAKMERLHIVVAVRGDGK